ncbi:GlsB/YeaQ/YmgE family stress response membrane protein [Kineococcus indalonis]|uniref:GlsB/YeaQ/YmgE family stress response membrane protein n=1 Tax=Kineococcus indalonis TaxID=2696566 RepID=UPI001411DEAE|nr:GlsB/YeaQ/YmgE family stress response membrane protein [Kineococcus indalonis]NAZ87084.1 GlsB/YeaQ/YmgE family stress response membrane protein [Kineococcus indalonis]
MISAIISAVVIGLIIGALARLVLPGRQNISILLTILVGIVAAVIGTFLANAIGVATTNGIDWIELVLQVAVAAVGVTVVGSISGRRR